VIARAGGLVLNALARRRREALESIWRRPDAVQASTLLDLVARARATEFGRHHGFDSIRSVAAYQERVPLREYLDFRPLWARALDGAADVTWPGRPRHWVKTSGTTAGDKLIPVTPEAFRSHRRGGWDALLLAAERAGGARLLGGTLLFLGGSSAMVPVGVDALVGDLSGLAVQRLPPGLRGRYSPGPEIAAIADWEQRIAALAALASRQDVRLLAGMPSWMLILFEQVARARQDAGRPLRDLTECWPNLGVFVHGGVSFAPYRKVFEDWIGRPLSGIEVYPASEAFLAVQTEAGGPLTLMLDYGIFYEFVPVEDLGHDRPRRHTVGEVELGRAYAVVLTTQAGLWSYLLGDTVRFVARDPLRLQIIGRTRHFVNAFGENVIVDEVERAAMAAARATRATLGEFTVAPRYPSGDDPRGAHDWLVEFRVPPTDRERFRQLVDETLATLNTDYRTKRAGDLGMSAPRLVELAPGTFHGWMRGAGRLGDQHKVPRVTNDRRLAEALLESAEAPPTSWPERRGVVTKA
jgi:hypothetical protein